MTQEIEIPEVGDETQSPATDSGAFDVEIPEIQAEASAQGVEPQQPEQQPEEQPPQVEANEMDDFQRMIASDPALRQMYLERKYGAVEQPQEQAQFQEIDPQETYQVPELPYDPADFDPTDFGHQQALVQQTVGQMMQQYLQPFAQYINSLEQEAQQEKQALARQQMQQHETAVHAEIDKHVAGFADIYKKSSEGIQPTVKEQSLVNAVHAQVANYIKANFPQQYWTHPQVYKDSVNALAPQLKEIAAMFGIQSGAKPQTGKQQAKEAYVQPSGAVPAQTRSAFDAAYESGDDVGMISAVLEKI